MDYADAMTYQSVPIGKVDPAPLNYQEVDEVRHQEVSEVPESQRWREDLMEAIASETTNRLGWSKKQASEFLMQTYGKATRAELTDDELMECAGHLMNIQPIVLEEENHSDDP